MSNKYFEPYNDKYNDYILEEAIKNSQRIIESNRKADAVYNKFYENIRKITYRAYELNDNRSVVFSTDGYKVYNSLKACIDDELCDATTMFIPDFRFFLNFNFDFQCATPVCETKFGDTTITFYATPVIY